MEELELLGLNEKIYIYHTSVGLPIYMWVNEKIKSMYMSLSVKYGSIDTKFKVGKKVYEVPNGTAHFLEHTKFNIDENTTAHDEFYKIGGDANAFTTFKYTNYIVMTTTNQKENLNLLLDYVYNPYFTKKTINKEKGIIVEEAKSGEDDPYTLCFFDSLKNTFQKSKYRNLITGNPDEVNSITVEDISLVYETFYHPQNMFLSLTGNFNPYEMAQLVEDNLTKKDFGEYQNPEVLSELEPKKVSKKENVQNINVSYPLIKYQIKMPRKTFAEYDDLKLKIITSLILNINFGSTSDFVDDMTTKGLITSMYANCDIYDEYFLISITISSNYPKEVIKALESKLNNLQFDETDFKRKKNALIATLILDYEDVENVNMRIQGDIIAYNKIIPNLKEILENIQITEALEIISLISLDNISLNIYKPKENQDE